MKKRRQKMQVKAQAMAEYFLILAVIVALTVIGVTSLLPKEEEAGVIKEAADNFYSQKVDSILNR